MPGARQISKASCAKEGRSSFTDHFHVDYIDIELWTEKVLERLG